MIEVSKINNILTNKVYNFEYPKKKLNKRELEKLSYISGLNFRFGINSDAIEFKYFLKEFLLSLLQDHKLYLIYVERKPKPKSRIRSHKRLLYPHKKELGINNVFEEEIEIEDDQTILSSIVKVNMKNLEYITNNLINSIFTFGYIVKKGKRSFTKNKYDFIKKVLEEDVRINKLIDLNVLKLTRDLINVNSAIFQIRVDGKDNQFIDLFTTKDNLNTHYEIIKGEVENKFYLKN